MKSEHDHGLIQMAFGIEEPAPAPVSKPARKTVEQVRGIAKARERRELFRKLKSVPCTDCGGTFPHYVMEFDHVRGTKVASVGDIKFYRLDRLLSEIEKCEVVCSNCHAIRTHQRSQPPDDVS